MKKFLSLILALTLVASLFTVNVMADSAQRTATLTTNATADLKAGDEVIVSIKLATTAKISALQYIFTYDKDAFEIDTTKGIEIGRDKYENFLETDWCNDVMKDEYNNWFFYFGKPILTYAVDGEIYCAWTDPNGEKYIEDNYAVENDLIGNFVLKVKDSAKSGDYTFGLKDAVSADTGEIVKASVIVNTTTVTVAGNEPEKEDIEVTPPSVSFTNTFEVGEDTFKHGAALLEFEVDGEANNEVKYITVTANNGSKTHTSTIDLKTTITSGTVKVGLNILNVPSDIASITFSKIVTSATAE